MNKPHPLIVNAKCKFNIVTQLQMVGYLTVSEVYNPEDDGIDCLLDEIKDLFLNRYSNRHIDRDRINIKLIQKEGDNLVYKFLAIYSGR